jgi:hypothetical protein
VDQNPPVVEGPYFDQKGANTEIQEEIDVFPTSQQAAEDLRVKETPAVLTCFVQYFNQDKSSLVSSLGHGATVGTITGSDVPIAKYAQGAGDIRLLIPMDINGGSVTYYYDDVIMVKGRFEAILDESNIPQPVAPTLAAIIDKAAAHRL